VTSEAPRLHQAEMRIALVRLLAVLFAALEVGIAKGGYPPHHEIWAWITTIAFAVGSVVLFWLSRIKMRAQTRRRIGAATLVFDTAVVSAFVLVFAFESDTTIRSLLFLPVIEAAMRYGLVGGITMPFALAPVLAIFEWRRSEEFAAGPFTLDHVTFPLGVKVIAGLIVGALVARLRREMALARARAVEAEGLRDELGRRADLLDAANRCARALSSSLEPDRAFQAFIRELRGLVPFDRVAIVLAEDGLARVMATAGLGADTILPAGSARPIAGSILEDVRRGETVHRQDMADKRHPEEDWLLELGLRCRLVAPLTIGAEAVGMLSLVRREPDSFTQDEIELISLLGRLVATAVQNIRAYEAERRTAEELRRLSALRADFVSLVSHELRSPMAAVIGAARTLQDRWRSLTPEQRESFLALIGDETNRLATLISDVLDTSRIEAGTFTYSFSDVDIGELIRESVAAAEVGQDEVRVWAEASDRLPPVRGDRARLRQVLVNLIDNAVKYSEAGGEVEVRAYPDDGRIRIDVCDRGPGIPYDQQKVIFEKFGRATAAGKVKPGTGLGLFIARSIAEAHGGTLHVASTPNRGATFTLALPVEAAPG
jgi:K+-sensing histidine kinase KdpD